MVASRVALSISMKKMIKNANHDQYNCDRKNSDDYNKRELRFLFPFL
jgi:hypothetical protein